MKTNDKVRVFKLATNEQTGETIWSNVINKGIVQAVNSTHVKVWDISEEGINISPYNAEWFPQQSRRIRVEAA